MIIEKLMVSLIMGMITLWGTRQSEKGKEALYFANLNSEVEKVMLVIFSGTIYYFINKFMLELLRTPVFQFLYSLFFFRIVIVVILKLFKNLKDNKENKRGGEKWKRN